MRKQGRYRVAPKPDRTRDGIVFASKKEANYYDELKLLKRAGEITGFSKQVSFDLYHGIRYVCDFIVYRADCPRQIIDVKGHKTDIYKLKKKLFEGKYAPEKIVEV